MNKIDIASVWRVMQKAMLGLSPSDKTKTEEIGRGTKVVDADLKW